MKFKKTKIKNCVEIFPSKLKDRRGFFQRIFCSKTFKEKKLNDIVVNINNSFSKFKGTTRGLHYQVGKFKETKIMRCIKGRCDLYVVDLKSPQKDDLGQVTLRQAVWLGLAQVLALIPGTSRSGITMTAARGMGFSRVAAARFSMLMSIPTILALDQCYSSPHSPKWACKSFPLIPFL